jgi:D-glycero-D-manno-heptose 1,7-bisphosphate phosphatase
MPTTTDTRPRYVLLDRDGTLIVERDHLVDPALVELLPGAGPGLKRMCELGLRLVVITNQSVVGRGFLSLQGLERIHERLREHLGAFSVRLEGIYFCPHLPDSGCECRKPRTGLVEQAVRELGLDPSRSFLIGDKLADLELGRIIHATTFLVRTGYGSGEESASMGFADYVVDNLQEAAEVIEMIIDSPLGE